MKKLLILGFVLASNLNASENNPPIKYIVETHEALRTTYPVSMHNKYNLGDSFSCDFNHCFKGVRVVGVENGYQLPLPIIPLSKDEENACKRYNARGCFFGPLCGLTLACAGVAVNYDYPGIAFVFATLSAISGSRQSYITTKNKRIDEHVSKEMLLIKDNASKIFRGELNPSSEKTIKNRLIADQMLRVVRNLEGKIIRISDDCE